MVEQLVSQMAIYMLVEQPISQLIGWAKSLPKSDMLAEQPVSQHIIGQAISLPNDDLLVGRASRLPTNLVEQLVFQMTI